MTHPFVWTCRPWGLLAGLACVALLGPAPGRGSADEPARNGFRILRDVAYYDGPDAHATKHKLDLFLPKDRKGFPVLLFVHGGAWVHGDKGQFFGLYGSLGMHLARHGVGVAVTNYRLSPGVRHPEHVRDVARAFAWTYRHIADYGGRPDQLFVCGHSAGGHLVALLTTDETYLKAEGLGTGLIKGVIPISGVYLIPNDILTRVFGTDPAVRRRASPQQHVRPDLPPFLILYAEKDFPTFDRGAEAFGKALRDKNVPAEVQEIKARNHLTILLQAVVEDDPVSAMILKFIARHAKTESAKG